jgi:hypothetical protein
MTWRQAAKGLCFALVLLLVTPVSQSRATGPHPRLAALPENTALDLGPYTCGAPEDNPKDCELITDYSGFVYDRFNHQLLMFGGGHAATHRTDVDLFSFGTLRWSSAYPSTPCSELRKDNRGLVNGNWLSTGHPIARHTYDMLVMTENTRELVMLSWGAGDGGCVEPSPPNQELYRFPGRIAAYDPISRRWTYSAAANGAWRPYGAAEYDPVSGLVFIIDYNGMWTYDPVKQVVTKRASFSDQLGKALSYAKNLVYFPPNQKMYYIADGDRVFEVSPNRTFFDWTSVTPLTGITGDIPKLQETGFAYDSVNRIIGGGVADGLFHAFDPVARRWTRLVMHTEPAGRRIGTVAYHALAYSPVDNVFVFITEDAGRHTWAYRYATSRSGAGGNARTR